MGKWKGRRAWEKTEVKREHGKMERKEMIGKWKKEHGRKVR
jgi:hypothetical protein